MNEKKIVSCFNSEIQTYPRVKNTFDQHWSEIWLDITMLYALYYVGRYRNFRPG